MNFKEIKEKLKILFCPWTDLKYSDNGLDNKKDNFILDGDDYHKIFIFGFKIYHRGKKIKQKFEDDKSHRKEVGF